MNWNAKKFLTKIDKKQLLIVALIFVLAFGVRAHLMRYELMFGFDSYFHAKVVSYLLQNGSIPERDPLAYYQMGGAPMPSQGAFFWYFTAAIYKIFTFGAEYDKETWIFFVKLLPALFGALISAAMYFLGKEIYSRKAGYAMAFVAAVVPSFVYRTLAGFFEEDSLGFLWLVIGLIFFVKSVKSLEFNRKTVSYAIISGLFFGIMALTWEMFMLIPMVLTGYLVFAVLNIATNKTRKELISFVKNFGISFAIFAVIATIQDQGIWIKRSVEYVLGVIPEGFFMPLAGIIVIVLGLLAYLVFVSGKTHKTETNKTVKFISLIMLYCILLAVIAVFFIVPDFRGEGIIERTVGEENTGKQFFGTKYNALILFPALALLLIPIRMFREKNEHLSGIVFFWVLITLFMAWYKLKFTYTFGLPIAAAAGLVTQEFFFYLKRRPAIEAKIIALPLAMMFLIGLSAATIFVPDKFPNIELKNGWKPALLWLKENTPKDAKMFNWWDEGHWISFVGERAVLIDNRNLDFQASSDMAKFIITPDLNEAVSIVKKYDADYVILDRGNFSKEGSLGFYAFETTNPRDPQIINYFVGVSAGIACSKAIDSQRGPIYTCGNNTFTEAQFNTIPSKWTHVPNQVENGKIPKFVYRDADGTGLYVVNPAVNNSTLTRLWFHEDETMKYFEEVYSFQGVKIFKVLK